MALLENPAKLQELLAAGSAGPGAMAALFAEHPDPTVRMLAEMWSRRAVEEAEEAAEPEPAPPQPEPSDPFEPTAAGRALRRRVRLLVAELERLQEVNDTLAAALGACPVCWGEDPICEVCAGRGGPGGRRPDPELFGRFVVPAARRLRKAEPSAAGHPGRPRADVSPIQDRATTPERREG